MGAVQTHFQLQILFKNIFLYILINGFKILIQF